MSDENVKYVVKLVIWALMICAFTFILVFDQADALEVVNWERSITKNNTTWYGYSIPTRASLTDGSAGPEVFINVARRNQTNTSWTTYYNNTLKIGLRGFDSDIADAITQNLGTGWTIPTAQWSETYSFDHGSAYDFYLTYGFRPGGQATTDQQVLESGFMINYDSIYSYYFDVIYYDPNSTSTITLDDLLKQCTNNIQFSCTYRNNLEVEKIIDTPTLQWYRYKNYMTSYWNPIGFNLSASDSTNNPFGVDGNNLWANDKPLRVLGKFIFSEPYGITLWTHESSMTCTDRCWTQEDTDNNSRALEDHDYMWDSLNSIVQNFDYHGFSGIVQLTYNTIIDLLRDANTTCTGLDIPVLGKTISLPSSCTFWGRQDVSTFSTFWQVLWIGLVSYFVCWRVFKDILKVYSPDSKIIDGNEVSDL